MNVSELNTDQNFSASQGVSQRAGSLLAAPSWEQFGAFWGAGTTGSTMGGSSSTWGVDLEWSCGHPTELPPGDGQNDHFLCLSVFQGAKQSGVFAGLFYALHSMISFIYLFIFFQLRQFLAVGSQLKMHIVCTLSF